MRRHLWRCFVAGMLLLPFSSGAGEGSVVVAYGLPFFALVSLGYLLVRAARPKLAARQLPYVIAGGMLAFALTVATTYAPSLVQSSARLVPNLIGFVVFLYLLDAEPGGAQDHTLRIARVYVASAALLSVYYLAHFFVALRRLGLLAVLWDRVTGGAASLPWGASNVVASCLIMPFFLSFFTAGRAPTARARRGHVLARGLMLVTVLITLSRGAILSLLVGTLAFALGAGGRQRWRLLAGLATGVVAVALIDHAMHGVISREVLGGFLGRLQSRDIATLDSRTTKYEEFFRLFARSPLLGTGYYGTIVVAGGTGHNLLTTTLAERGVIGFLFSGVVLLLAAWRVLQGWLGAGTPIERLLFLSLLAGGGASLLHLMFEDANFTHQYIIYSWVALALAFGAAHEPRTRLAQLLPSRPTPVMLDT